MKDAPRSPLSLSREAGGLNGNTCRRMGGKEEHVQVTGWARLNVD